MTEKNDRGVKTKMRAMPWIIILATLWSLPARAGDDAPLELRAQWRAAAEAGDVEAQFRLGESYCCGYGVGHDTARALYWMCRAGKQGHVEAQYELARELEQDTDSHRPFTARHFIIEAYVWYTRAVEEGDHPLAELYRRRLAASFTPGDWKIAEARLADWSESGCERYTGD